jgi:hypothetical protein
MNRIISPPLEDHARLRTPLTRGEREFLDILLARLPEEWEIYIQPHLNGLRPDFVLLHPKVGVAVYEIKDWDLDAMRYFVKHCPGSSPRLMAEKDGQTFSLQPNNPVERIQLYKEEIHNLYCPRTDQRAGYALITAGIVFPYAESRRVCELLSPFQKAYSMDQWPSYYPIIGRDTLNKRAIDLIMPSALRQTSKYMSEATAQDLRSWLVEPEVSAEQRQPLELNAKQRELITTRTTSGYRKLKGPAGSGKSLVLAARAAQLISEGKSVLVITYNITLINYLMDLSVRWPRGQSNTREQITWLNFHHWCKRVCYETGHRPEYKALWGGVSEECEMAVLRGGQNIEMSINKVLAEEMPALVDTILSGPDKQHTATYDAILVDEGQDMRLEWWNCLRKVNASGGEMILVADTTQDIYETVQYWTDEKMRGSGLVGSWSTLDISYRLPDEMIAQASNYASVYLPKDSIDLPRFPSIQPDFFTKLRWVQTDPATARDVICAELLRLAPSADPGLLSMADITFLSADQRMGLSVVKEMTTKGIRFLHTFDEEGGQGRRLKLAFFKGDARLKATTLHSFKGWESRALIVYTGTRWDNRSKSLIYTGLTRLKKTTEGSFITVINSIPELASYGKNWPDYSLAKQCVPNPIGQGR